MSRSNVLQSPFLQDEAKAHEFLEAIRWPSGPICPHCEGTKIYRLKPNKTGRRVLKCAGCRKQFSVMVGTIFEDSHLPLSKWLAAIHLLCASKKSMSAHQLHRMLGVTYKTAWFMAHRIRYAMVELSAIGTKLGGIVEIDETYVGGKSKGQRQGFKDNKTPVVSLVQRGGDVRSFVVDRVTGRNLKEIIKREVDSEAHLMTDQFSSYRGLFRDFASHQTVDHSKFEWTRGPVHTNTVEGYFGLLKRGIIGTFHHVSAHHLHRYLSEFDFRYNQRGVNDLTRSMLAMKGIEGKRLTYR
jgi:transposase-like protein